MQEWTPSPASPAEMGRAIELGRTTGNRIANVAERSTGANEVVVALKALSTDELVAMALYDYWRWKRDEAGQEAGEREATKQGKAEADEWLVA